MALGLRRFLAILLLSFCVGNDSLCCDRTSERADICFARGDLRMHSASASFQLVSAGNSTAEEERIRPYTRKWEANVMATIDEVRLRRVVPGDAARCDVRHDVPAVLFSTGGYTGNVYHEFNDGILPLFVTAHHLRRRVVLVILEYHDWSDYTANRRVHCFPEVIAGLRIHGELTVDPARTPEGKSIGDFRRLLDDAYRGRIEFLERLERRAARKRLCLHHRRRGAVCDRDSVELGLESNPPSASLYRGLRGEISVRDGACNRSWRAWQDGEISSSTPFHFLAFYF